MDIKIIVDGKEIKDDYVLKIKDNMSSKTIVKSNDFHFLGCLIENEYDEKKDVTSLLENNKNSEKCNCPMCMQYIEKVKKAKKMKENCTENCEDCNIEEKE